MNTAQAINSMQVCSNDKRKFCAAVTGVEHTDWQLIEQWRFPDGSRLTYDHTCNPGYEWREG